jgi:hypothetical protein
MKLCIGLFSDVLVYWRGGGQLDSVSKLRVLNDVCTSIGVTTTATKLNGVWIVPLLSWYHQVKVLLWRFDLDIQNDVCGLDSNNFVSNKPDCPVLCVHSRCKLQMVIAEAAVFERLKSLLGLRELGSYSFPLQRC